jgi:hypothetical protein
MDLGAGGLGSEREKQIPGGNDGKNAKAKAVWLGG